MATLLAKVVSIAQSRLPFLANSDCRQQRQYGFCFVDNMPATPEETRALLEQIGPIRNTHYGKLHRRVIAIIRDI